MSDAAVFRYRTGNMLADGSDALVNTVNCVGIMGRGIALQFKKAYPDNFKAYAAACAAGKLKPGTVFVYATGRLAPPRFIINFPTKRHWRDKSRLEDIETGLADLARIVREHNITSIAVPPLGSGLGGLDWRKVKPLIGRMLSGVPGVEITVYEPSPVTADRAVKTADRPVMTPGRAALIGLVKSYLAGLLDPFVTLLEAQKLMYFLQEAGECLRLDFVKYKYGPYAHNLRHVFNAMEGHYLTGYADGGDDPNKPISILPGAVEEADAFLEGFPATKSRFDRVVGLADGFETPVGMELLATVHWVGKHEAPGSFDKLVETTHAWDARKRLFTARQIGVALDALEQHGFSVQR